MQNLAQTQPKTQFPQAARRPLVEHLRSAHATDGAIFFNRRTFTSDEQGAKLLASGRLIIWRGVETTPRAVNALTRHAATAGEQLREAA